MKHLSTTFSLLLVFTLLISFLTACGDSEPGNVPSAGTDVTTEETAAVTSIYDDLPTGNYDGYEFRVLNNWSNFAYTSFGEEGLTGEALDDAIYERNITVSDLLNITITSEQKRWDDNETAFTTAVLAGDDLYDIYFNEGSYQSKHAQNGYVNDLSGIGALDPDAPWWNQAATESIRIGSPLYYLYGDIHLMYYECYCGMLTNITALEDVGLEVPYDLVKQGVWTVDRASEYIKAGTVDLNGDGVMNADDCFGLGLVDHNAVAFLRGSGLTIVERDGNNIPVWNGLTEKFVSRYTTVAEKIFADKTQVCRASTPGVSAFDRQVNTMFGLVRLVFFTEPLGAMSMYRTCDFEVGIIPVPKYDEAQEEYAAYIYKGAPAMGIPITNTELERTGVIAENLCAYSLKGVRNIYFDATLDCKYIADDKSEEMLDIIFSNGSVDLAFVYGWANYTSGISTRLASGETDIASFAAGKESALVSEIQKTVEYFG